jgi:hypothetical protein
MSIRVWASPWVQRTPPGGGPLFWIPKAYDYCTTGRHIYAQNADGSLEGTWGLTFGRAASWTAALADPQMTDVFAGDLPNVESMAELRTFLKGRTIANLSTTRRTAIQANLDALGIPRSDFTNATTLYKVFQRVLSHVYARNEMFGADIEVA